MGLENQEVPTNIGNIGCDNSGKVFMQINFELAGKPATLTVTMSSLKAQEVQATIAKSVEQGAEWLRTGVPPK